MRYKLLGKSGLRVSEVCLGVMTMGLETASSAGPEESHRMMEYFVDKGGNYFDTANEIYNGGLSEKCLGEFIHADRERYVIATKFTDTVPNSVNPKIKNDPNAGGNHKKSMVQSVERSLKRLNTDYVDLLWVHFWDYSVNVEDVMRNLNDLVQSGKVLHIGMSNTPAWVVARGQTIAEQRGWEPISALQYQYNLIVRDLDHEVLPCARSLDICMTSYSALAGGLLTGKYTRGSDGDKKRFDDPYFASMVKYRDEDLAIARKVDEIADKLGVSSSAVAIAWLQGQNVLPIVGVRKLSQLESNLAHLGLVLVEEDMQALNELSAPPRTWLYDTLHAEDSIGREFASGGLLKQIDNYRFPV